MYKLLRTVCNASCPEMNSEYIEKRHEITHRLLPGMNSQIRISESSDSEQHNEEVRETKRVTSRPGKPEKNEHLKKKLAGTVAHQSLLIPNQNFSLWYEEFVLNSLILCREHVALFLTIKRQPIAKFLKACLLLLSNASFILLMHAKRGCGAAAFPEIIISFSL